MSADRENADPEKTDYLRTISPPMPIPGFGSSDCARRLAEWNNAWQAYSMTDFPWVLGDAAAVVNQGVLQC